MRHCYWRCVFCYCNFRYGSTCGLFFLPWVRFLFYQHAFSFSNYEQKLLNAATPPALYYKERLILEKMVLSVLLVNVTTTDLFRDDSQYARLNISRFSSPRRPRSLTELSQQSFAKKGFHEIPFYSDVDLNVYFFVSLLVGTPPQRQSVILDTGSSLLGFPCNHCINCGRHIDPPFDPRISQTGYWVSCKHPMCVIRFCTTSLPRGKCKYFQGYSEGSEVSGAYFSDLVAIGETEKRSSFVRYHHIGCHSSETNLFLNQVMLIDVSCFSLPHSTSAV